MYSEFPATFQMYLISRKDAKNAKELNRFPWRALRLCENNWTLFWNSYLACIIHERTSEGVNMPVAVRRGWQPAEVSAINFQSPLARLQEIDFQALA